ncbi:hypothetical protein [Sporomusa acidovorans]|uniref:Uncharacterized protein n=1 Tax=Sporomusa acidovorans (strain ATCC 49682 / DSM 3132 / Mol) TaxID=1123286 RepID=A0ABZ3J2D0_SPOA4|nr:hypothetical protein [Sporomusa acidovorans]OZC24326.1 hypothetical protein SPACI_00130 [Sporomusa acidovorans DSM 3132]SDF76512.1 hypothetical protein SAMN04488499_10798 [Sporomusa acidovorans]
MRIYRIVDLLMLGGRTGQGYPFILAGCIPDEQAYNLFVSAGYELQSLIVSKECDPVTLDCLLANRLQSLAAATFLAGCTLHVPGVAGFSGGVLGDPGQTACSAGGCSEAMNNGWSLLTFPGGPGLAADREIPDLPARVQAICTESVPNHMTLISLSEYLTRMGAGKVIGITDGSGPTACGAALIRQGEKTEVWRLAEL